MDRDRVGAIMSTTLEDRIYQFIQGHPWTTFAELKRHFGDEFAGSRTGWLDEERNLLLWPKMSERFVEALNNLLQDGKIVMKPAPLWIYLLDGVTLSLPLARGRYRYREPHWVPVYFDVKERGADGRG
jgi:hypothetical protein